MKTTPMRRAFVREVSLLVGRSKMHPMQMIAASVSILAFAWAASAQDKAGDPGPAPGAQQAAAQKVDTLPPRMAGRWRTDDGRFGNTHELIVESVDGQNIRGTLIVWSGRCPGRPAPFVGTYDGRELKFSTGADSPCSPAKYALKRQGGGANLFEGTWEVSDFRGFAYFNPK